MSETPCPGCGSKDIGRLLAVPEMMFGRGESFSYTECGTCGTLRLLDPPVDMGVFYPADYYSLDVDPEVALGRRPVRWFAALVASSALHGRGLLARAAAAVIRMRQFRTLVSLLDSVALAELPRGRRTKVLDVGCGSGALVYTLSLAGLHDVTGIDPFAPGDRTFGTGARVLRQDLTEVTTRYDLVMLHHSFEHVPDPVETLRRARALLTDIGRILVRMPTPSSEAYDRYGADWVQFDPPRHLTLFSRAGMAALCRREGLEVVATHDDSTSFQFWGSEQARRGVTLTSPTSHMMSPRSSAFSRRTIGNWDREAKRLNRSGRGDQAAWVLRPAPPRD